MLLNILFFISCLAATTAYQNGAPEAACMDLNPHVMCSLTSGKNQKRDHTWGPYPVSCGHAEPMNLMNTNTTGPYKVIVANSATAKAGVPTKVTISSASQNIIFKGFLCAVSVANDSNHTPVGVMSESDAHMQTINCSQGQGAGANTGITHYNPQNLSSSDIHNFTTAKFYWTAPPASEEHKYKLRCVIVKDLDHSWNDYENDITVVNSSPRKLAASALWTTVTMMAVLVGTLATSG